MSACRKCGVGLGPRDQRSSSSAPRKPGDGRVAIGRRRDQLGDHANRRRARSPSLSRRRHRRAGPRVAASRRRRSAPSTAGSRCRDPRRQSRASMAWPDMSICVLAAAAAVSPEATRSCHSTRSSPVIASVTGCSTCRRVFISMKYQGAAGRQRAALDQELDGAGALVGHRLGAGDGRLGDLPAQLGRHARRRGLLDHLLVAPLQRAVALEQMHDVAVGCRRTPAPRCGAGRRSPSRAARGVAEGRLRLALRRSSSAAAKSASRSTRRMPRPPPPATALIITG